MHLITLSMYSEKYFIRPNTINEIIYKRTPSIQRTPLGRIIHEIEHYHCRIVDVTG